MNIDKEVNMKLFQQQQEQSRHLDYEKEFGIYKAIANGNMEEVKARHKEYEEHKGYTTGNDKNGVLSADPLQYWFPVTKYQPPCSHDKPLLCTVWSSTRDCLQHERHIYPAHGRVQEKGRS